MASFSQFFLNKGRKTTKGESEEIYIYINRKYELGYVMGASCAGEGGEDFVLSLVCCFQTQLKDGPGRAAV